MNPATVVLLVVCLLGAAPSQGEGPSRLGTRIPREFQGRWMSSPEQCRDGHEGWEYISNLKVQNSDGEGNVVSVRRRSALEIEVDLTWRRSSASAKATEDWRQVHLYSVSADGRTLTDTTAGKTVIRARCE